MFHYGLILWTYTLVCLVILLIGVLRTRAFYWLRLSIPHDPPTFGFGNLNNFSTTRHICEKLREKYNKYKHSGYPFCGFYFFFQPIALVTDLNLARDVLIRDVHNFDDRWLFHNKRDDPYSSNLFTLGTAERHKLRKRLLPIFDMDKMQLIYPIVLKVGEELAQTFAELQNVDAEQDMYELLKRYTIDVLVNCIFGVESDGLKQQSPNHKFSKLVRRLNNNSRHSNLVKTLRLCVPNMTQSWRRRVTPDRAPEFYLRLVEETIAKREAENIQRDDLMNTFIELKNAKQEENRLSIAEITANSALFFKLGYETTSTTMTFALYELAVNQDVQTKLRTEILEVLTKHGGKLSNEALLEMKYLGMVLAETLRMHPTYPFLERVSTDDYHTSKQGLVIYKGTKLFIPIEAIQNDPEIYAEPTKFIPERFDAENIRQHQILAWLPFGEGPRNCFGMRFSQLLIRIGLISLLTKYKFTPSSRTPIPLEYEETSLELRPKGGVYLRADSLQCTQAAEDSSVVEIPNSSQNML